jgi:hypothetical protein
VASWSNSSFTLISTLHQAGSVAASGSMTSRSSIRSFLPLVFPRGTTDGLERTDPDKKKWGGKVGALIDPDGTLIRLIEEPKSRR